MTEKMPSWPQTVASWDQPTQPMSPPGGHGPGTPPWVAPPARRGVSAGAVLAIVVGVLVLLCSGVGFILMAGSAPPQDKPVVIETSAAAPAPSKAAPASKAAPVHKLGQPVRAGDFLFTVHSKKCGISEVGKYLKTKAQGSFCRLDVSAKNVTRSAHYFNADSTVTVTDTQGRTFSADGKAGIYGNEDAAGWLDEINPGNSVRAFIYFDVSGGVKLASATFSAGTFTTAKDAMVVF